MKRSLFFILLPFSFLSGLAQYYDTGQDPATASWKVIRTNHFRVIFQEEFARNANKLANNLEYAYTCVPNSWGVKPPVTDIVLHNQTVVPNAFALLTPFRAEFYTCPSQNSYAQDWMQQLALHEYRHMIQYYNLNRGFTRALYLLSGQHAPTLMFGLFMPMWFIEGDAVCTETLLSGSGRGRIPSFEMKTRAQVLEKGTYSFSKAQLGSYRNYIPDEYFLGYNYVSYARKLYGMDIFKHALTTAVRKPWLLAPLSHGIREISGLSKEKLYEAIYDSLSILWKNQKIKTTLTTFRRISLPTRQSYVNYRLPRFLNDSMVLSEKSGRDIYPRIISIDRSGREKVIFAPGYFTSELVFPRVSTGPSFTPESNSPGSFTMDNLTIAGDKIAWAGMKIDPRWKHRSYSIIKLYDIKENKIKQLTKKTRYFSPCFFPDGKKIVVSEVNYSGDFFLTLIDAATGKELQKYQTPGQDFFTYPSVSRDGRYIYSVVIGDAGKSLVQVDAENGAFTSLMPFSFHEISRPVDNGQFIFFNGDYSGIDNIYALNKESGAVSQVTSSEYGAIDPDFSNDGSKMIYSDYTADGFALVETDLDPSSWKRLGDVEDFSPQIWKYLQGQESGLMTRENIPDSQYLSRPYSKAGHLINIHSWAPLSYNMQTGSIKPGFSVMSQNLLSTAFLTAGYEFEKKIQDGRFHLDFSYRGLYPVIDFSAETGIRVVEEDDQSLRRLKESGFFAGMNIPLNFIHNQYAFRLVPEARYRFIHSTDPADSEKTVDPSVIHSIESRLLFSWQIKKAELDLRPLWGQTLDLNYQQAIFSAGVPGNLASAEITLLFPGIGRHHSLMFNAGWQEKNRAGYDYREIIGYPRGYYYQSNDRLVALSASYLLPLAFPDLELGRLLFLKRINANVFSDFARASVTEKGQKDYRSHGLEFTGEFHFFQLLIPVELGLRTSWLPLENRMDFRFLFSLNVSDL